MQMTVKCPSILRNLLIILFFLEGGGSLYELFVLGANLEHLLSLKSFSGKASTR